MQPKFNNKGLMLCIRTIAIALTLITLNFFSFSQQTEQQSKFQAMQQAKVNARLGHLNAKNTFANNDAGIVFTSPVVGPAPPVLLNKKSKLSICPVGAFKTNTIFPSHV